MATTETTLPGNGTAGPFTYTFPALAAENVYVSVDGTAKTVGVDYSLDFANKQITFLNTPYPTAAEVIRIYRDTDDAALSAEFYSGAAIRATDLNNNFNQALYIAQETKAITVQASTGNLADGSITSNLIANGAVTTAKISDNNVTTAKLADDIVTTAKLADSNVTTAKLADSNVTTAKLADGSVTAAKLSTTYLPTTGGTMTGAITFVSGQTYPQVPQNAKTAAYTLVAGDAGKHISITTGGVTIPQNVFSVGDAISIYNNSGSSQTITQGTGVTIRLPGTSLTGNRTLSQYGLCTVLCVASNVFVVSGSGLS